MTPGRPEPGLLALRRPASSTLGRLLTHILIAALLFALAPPHAIAATSIRPGPPTVEDLVRPPLTSSPRDVHTCVVVVVADPSGLTKSAFGELLAHTGADPQPYAFTGEPLDPNSGFQYHRARWMDPRAGRFTGMDPWEGDPDRPATLRKYPYADASPVNYVDPSGLQSLGTTMVTLTINVSLNALSTFNPAAPVTSVAAALLSGTAETFIPIRVPARILQTAWRYARPIGGGIFKFGDAALVGFKSPIASYRLLVDLKKGQGAALQAHHILEARHLRNTFGWTTAQIREAPAQILTQAEHAVINTRLAKRLPTGVVYTKQQIWAAYQEVYAQYPGYLAAIAHLF